MNTEETVEETTEDTTEGLVEAVATEEVQSSESDTELDNSNSDAPSDEAPQSDTSKTEIAKTETSKDSPPNADSIDDSDLANYVEAMVFSSAAPIQSLKISQALNLGGVSRIKKAISSLNESYEASGRSFRIRQLAGGYQFYVLPQWSECLKKLFSKTRKIRLTKAALETMAVVAYKQPVSKNQIEFIRGVASDGVIHNLLEKNLIRISGRSEGAGRSLLYSATEEFLKFFGLNSFDDLPRIAEIEELIQHMELERAANMSDEAQEGSDDVESAELESAEADSAESDSVDLDVDISADEIALAESPIDDSGSEFNDDSVEAEKADSDDSRNEDGVEVAADDVSEVVTSTQD